jgi:hypothetical protein
LEGINCNFSYRYRREFEEDKASIVHGDLFSSERLFPKESFSYASDETRGFVAETHMGEHHDMALGQSIHVNISGFYIYPLNSHSPQIL